MLITHLASRLQCSRDAAFLRCLSRKTVLANKRSPRLNRRCSKKKKKKSKLPNRWPHLVTSEHGGRADFLADKPKVLKGQKRGAEYKCGPILPPTRWLLNKRD